MRNERAGIYGWISATIIFAIAATIVVCLWRDGEMIQSQLRESAASKPTMDFQHDPLRGNLPATSQPSD